MYTGQKEFISVTFFLYDLNQIPSIPESEAAVRWQDIFWV